MTLGVMQPYLFPYLGYYQLMRACDRFAVLDDVTFINRGWINRNHLLVHGEPHLFTVPLVRASQNRLIRDIAVATGDWRTKLMRTIATAYARAPHYRGTSALVGSVLEGSAGSIGDLAFASLRAVHEHVGLSTTLIRSTDIYDNQNLRGQARILDICRREGAEVYANLPGGRALYDAESFRSAGIELRFLDARAREYPQLGQPFQPDLSIIDVLMFNGPAGTRRLLDEYRLVPAE
jgi:hypothetical protein